MAENLSVDGGKGRKRGKRGGVRHRKAEASGGELVSVSKKSLGSLVNLMASSWDGARESQRRGYVQLPSKNPEQSLNAADREKIAQKVRAGEQNVGLVKRFIEKPALLIGNLRPQANTGNDEFDSMAEECFWSRAKYPEAFDAAGRFSFLDWQRWVRESKRRDGDCLSVLTEGAEGGGRLRCYEALQIGSGSWAGRNMPANLKDGVYLDKFGGRAAFQLLNPDGTRSAVVPRNRAIYHGSEVRVGRPRSVSSLAHGIANFLDAVEILADTKHAVKVAALWGAWVESDKDGGTGDPGEDLKDLLRTAGETAELLDENGSWQSGEPTAEELGEVIGAEAFQGGGRLQEFGAGKRLQTLKNDNPGPNVVELLRWLVRDICTDVSMEILWDATRMSGPGMRFVMAELQRFISHQQEVNERDCQRVWMYLLAKDIQRGKLIVPPDVAASWYKVSWLAEKDMTIDRGRDGVLDLQLLEREKITDEEWWGRQGKDWKTEETKIYRQKLWREEMEKREREAFESRMRG